MEKQNQKHSYLQYFPQKQGSIHRNLNPKRTEYPKILPHIIEEYQYRITNHLLIKKIISPKRDKVIMNSLEKIKRSVRANTASKLKMHSRSNLKQSQRAASPLEERRNHKSDYRLKTADFKHKSAVSFYVNNTVTHQKFLRQKVQIIKNDYQTEPSLIEKVNETRNNPIYRSLYQRKKQARQEALPTEIYGFGPTILSIYHIEITSNPPLKGDTLMQLQLVEKSIVGSLKDNLGSDDKEKVVHTHPIAVDDLPKQEREKSKIKFALKVSKIGDFVPLRLWKYAGVESQELGTADIPLSLYRFGLSEGASLSENENFQRQSKQGSNQLSRMVLSSELTCQLRRGNSQEIQVKLHLKYKLYSKRFSKHSIGTAEA